jgi:hypothetical protein
MGDGAVIGWRSGRLWPRGWRIDVGTWDLAVSDALGCVADYGVSFVVMVTDDGAFPFTVRRYADVWDNADAMASVARVVDPS